MCICEYVYCVRAIWMCIETEDDGYLDDVIGMRLFVFVFVCKWCLGKAWWERIINTPKGMRQVLRITTHHAYATRMDWMIWKMAEPQTTNRKRANSQGPTGYWSPFDFCVEWENILILVNNESDKFGKIDSKLNVYDNRLLFVKQHL